MEWEFVIRAGSALLAVQLLVLVVLLIRQRSFWMAVLCYAMVAWFLRQFFWGASGNKALIITKAILIGGYQEIFISPTVFLIILGLVGQISWKRKLLVSSPAVLFFGTYLTWALFFNSSFKPISDFFFLFYLGFDVLLNFAFLILSIGYLRRARQDLISIAFYKYFILIVVFLPQQIISCVLSALGTAEDYQVDFLIQISHAYDLEPFHFMAYLWSFVQGTFLIVLVLSELKVFKRIQLPKKLFKDDFNIEANLDIRRELENNRIYQNPNLSVEEAAKTLGLTKKAFALHLQALPISFNELINAMRIDDFKAKVRDEEYQKYDLVSIAKMCGFSSKATFNRVFKEKEGVTPSEFRKQFRSELR